MATIARAALGQRRALFVPREAAARAARPARPRDGRARRRARPALPRALPRERTSTRARFEAPMTSPGYPVVSRDEVCATPSASAPPILATDTGSCSSPRERRGNHSASSTIAARCSLNVAYGERERALVESAFVGKRVRYTRLQLGSDLTENVDRVRGFMAATSFRPLRPRYVRAVLEPGARPRGRGLIDAVRPDIMIGCRLAPRGVLSRRRRARRAEPPPQGAPVHMGSHVAGRTEADRRDVRHPGRSRSTAQWSVSRSGSLRGREGFHLHEDLCHLDVVDRDGARVPDGEPGEIVLSNLVNRGSVLLNYRIGDLGRISTEPCACGRTTQVLADLEGRVSEYVTKPRTGPCRSVRRHGDPEPRSRHRALPARPGLDDVVRAATRHGRPEGVRRGARAPQMPSGRSSAAATSRRCTSRRCRSSRAGSIARSCCSRRARPRSSSASPWPPPEQIAASPSPPPSRRRLCTSVARMRAPEAPIGWPSATAPPLTFTVSGSAPRMLDRVDGHRAEGLVDLDALDVADRLARPARAPACRLRRACGRGTRTRRRHSPVRRSSRAARGRAPSRTSRS